MTAVKGGREGQPFDGLLADLRVAVASEEFAEVLERDEELRALCRQVRCLARVAGRVPTFEPADRPKRVCDGSYVDHKTTRTPTHTHRGLAARRREREEDARRAALRPARPR